MVRQWKTSEKKAVEVDPRNLKMQSAQAIRIVADALVELITNSDDAYHEIGDDRGKIIVEVTRLRGEKSGVVVVKDRAGGMSLEEMKKKILKYGAFSAAVKSRGFMGRGAKDIVALGCASFEAIKEGSIHRIDIDSQFEGDIKKSDKATKEDYDTHGLRPGKGGMQVTLAVSKRHSVPLLKTLVRDLQRLPTLRDLICRRDVRLSDGKSEHYDTLRYTSPEGELVYDDTLVFDAPYEGAKAHLQLFKSPDELPSDLQEGVIVCDGRAVHQVTRFGRDLDEDAIGRRFFGRIECAYIRHLQLEFEKLRDRGEESDHHNPVDMVDPNRRRGLDREHHPFVMKLFDWAEEILRAAVEEVREEEGQKESRVASEQTKKRLKELSKAVADHLKSRLEEETLAPRTPDQEAALQQEGVLLNPPFARVAVGETRRLGYTVLSFGEGEDPDHVTVELRGEGLEVDSVKPLLRPQKRNPDRLSSYFEITGISPSECVTLTVTHANDLIKPIERQIEVTEATDPYANLPFGVFFEKQNYTVRNNGTRTLSFVARGRRFRKVGWDSQTLIDSSRQEAVSILRGKTLTVHTPAKDIWKGEVQVRGQGVGKSTVVTLSIPTKDGIEKANARVKVVAKDEPPAVSIEIKLVPEKGGQWRAVWDRDNPNLLKVYAEHPTLVRYLGPREQKYPGQERPHFGIILAEIVADKVVQRILQARIESNPRLFSDADRFFFLHSEEMTVFLPVAHKIMVSDYDVNRLIAD